MGPSRASPLNLAFVDLTTESISSFFIEARIDLSIEAIISLSVEAKINFSAEAISDFAEGVRMKISYIVQLKTNMTASIMIETNRQDLNQGVPSSFFPMRAKSLRAFLRSEVLVRPEPSA